MSAKFSFNLITGLFLIVLLVSGCQERSESVFTRVPRSRTVAWGESQDGIRLGVDFEKTAYEVGEVLKLSVVRFKNEGEEDLELVGPTLVVMRCIIQEPTGSKAEAFLAEFTGRDPYNFPKRVLRKGEIVELRARGFWKYTDDRGLRPYLVNNPGQYKIYCKYEEVKSNIVEVEVR
jgi:hypothetical protein